LREGFIAAKYRKPARPPAPARTLCRRRPWAPPRRPRARKPRLRGETFARG